MQINKFIKSKLSSKFTFLLLYLDITKKEKYMLLVVIILNLLSSYLSLNSFFLLSFREFSSTGEHSLIIMHPLDLTTPSLVVGGCCNTNFPPPSYSYYYSVYPGTVFLSLYYFVWSMSHSTYPKSNGLCIIFHLVVEFLNLEL